MYLWPYFVLVFLHYCTWKNVLVKCQNHSEFTPKGLYPAILTPFTKTGEINMTAIPLYAQYFKKIGVDGVLVSGTNGEGPNLSTCEKKRLLRAWVKEAKKYGFKVMAQIGGVAEADIIDLAKFSVTINVDVILVLPTLYYAPKSPENLVKLMKAVSSAAPSLPLLYYDFPMMSKVNLNMAKFFKQASAEIPQFKGIKTELQTAVTIRAVNDLRSDQTILIPNEKLLSSAVSLGYDTYTTALLSVCPDLVFDVINYTRAGEMTRARKAHDKLNRVSAAIKADFDVISSYKVAARIATGINFGGPRLPLEPVTKEGEKNIRRIMKENGIKIAK